LSTLDDVVRQKKELAEALRESEERLRQTLEAAQVGIWEWRIPENQVEWSPNIERIFGLEPGTFGRTYEDFLALVHPDDRAQVAARVSEVIETGRPYDTEFRFVRPDGTTGWLSGRGQLVRDAAGAPRLLRGVVFDVTRQRTASDTLILQAQVLENMSEGVSVADERGFIVYTNPAEDRMFGYGPGELRGQHVTVQNAYPREENERIVARVIATLQARGEWIGEWANKRKDGTPFTTRSRITSVRLNAAPHWICVQEDITEQVRTRERSEELASTLLARERQLRLITDALPALVAYVDRDERYQFTNAAYLSWFGVEPQSLIGRTMRDLIGDAAYAGVRGYIRRALDGERVEYESELPLPDGRTLYVHPTYIPDKDERGETRGFVALTHDVTEQVQARTRAESLAHALRESEARYRTFVSQSTEGIWRFELEEPISTALPATLQVAAFFRHGVLAECNDAMARMYGYERAEELVGKRVGDFLVADDPRNLEYLRAFVVSGYRLENAESIETDRHGARRIFQNSLVGIVEGGRIVRAWGTQRDVTAQVDAREQAEAASRAKDEFLAMLGHELRNPLSPILTALELMRLRGADMFQKERGVIERQVKHVVRLVDDLLDVSRMTRGKVALDEKLVEIADIVAAAIELASPLLEQRKHRLSIAVPRGLVVRGDPVRLGQVFSNLLTNAAKYTPPEGTVTITAGRTGETIQVSVRDTGIGIGPHLLPRVFDLFVQEPQRIDRAAGGLGLGLAIVRSLVTLHGGAVAARSEGPGKGSEFTVTLPAAAAPGAELGAPHEAAQDVQATAGLRILVVDDNSDAAELLSDALGALGHVVSTAADGPTALRLLEEITPDVALLDIGLPVMDGYELARRIRALPRFGGMPLVAVTGYGQPADRSAALAAGFDEHLIKPVDLRALETTLERLSPASR
jgi:PAS domain S-box-containing protein